MVKSVYYSVQPDAEYAGDNHLAQIGLVGYADYLHYLFEQMSQGVRCEGPDDTAGRTEQQGMGVPVHRPAASKQVYNQNLNVNYDVGEDKNGHVNILFESQPKEAAGPEMIRCKRHFEFYLGQQEQNVS
jgi:hypothetical protein